MENLDKRNASLYAIELTKIVLANPSTQIIPCKESASDIVDFIDTIANRLVDSSKIN